MKLIKSMAFQINGKRICLNSVYKYVVVGVAVLLYNHGFSQATFTSTGNTQNWTTTSTWSCGGCGRNYPGAGGVEDDIVIIEHVVGFTSGSSVASVTVGSVTIRNVSAIEARLNVNGNSSGANGRTLNVTGNVTVEGTSTHNAVLRIFDDARVNVGGNLNIVRTTTHPANFSAQLDIYNTAKLTVAGDFSYAGNSTQPSTVDGVVETLNEIDLARNGGSPEVVVTGNLIITMNTTQQTNLNLILRASSLFTVGGNATLTVVDGGPETRNNINIYLSSEATASLESDNTATIDASGSTLRINGDLIMTVPDDNDTPDVRTYIRGNSKLEVLGYIVCNYFGTLGDAEIQFKLADNASLACNSFTLNSATDTDSNNIYITALEDAYITVNGDIIMEAPDGAPTANYISMAGNSTLDLKGNVIRAVDTGANSDGAIEFSDNSLARFSGSTGIQIIYATYTGSANAWQENVAGTTARVYRRLSIDNTSGNVLTLAQPIVVRTSLAMNNGVISTTSSSYIAFSYADGVNYPVVISNAGNTGSYVDGPVRKLGTSSITLPLGNGTVWAPLELNNVTTPSGDPSIFPDLFIEYHATTPPVLTTDGTFDHVSTIEYWSFFSNDAYVFSIEADIVFHWKNACYSDIQDVSATPQDLFMATRTNMPWSQINSTIDAASQGCDAATVGNETGYITSPDINLTPSIGGTEYWFTFSTSFNLNTLPVELMDFKAERSSTDVNVSWATVNEHMSDKFEIERSHDGKDFVKAGEVKGVGESIQLRKYSFTDRNVSVARLYYRLKLVDADGKYTYSKVVAVAPDTSRESDIFKIHSDSFNLELTAGTDGMVEINIYSMEGRNLFRKIQYVSKGTENTYNLSSIMRAPGMYIVSAVTVKKRQSQKIMIR